MFKSFWINKMNKVATKKISNKQELKSPRGTMFNGRERKTPITNRRQEATINKKKQQEATITSKKRL